VVKYSWCVLCLSLVVAGCSQPSDAPLSDAGADNSLNETSLGQAVSLPAGDECGLPAIAGDECGSPGIDATNDIASGIEADD
jgi:hypothetical protein